MNNKYNTSQKILEFVNRNKGLFANTTELAPYLHELGHKYYETSIISIAKSNDISYNEAKNIIDSSIGSFIHDNNLSCKLTKILSEYARTGYDAQNYSEIVAEAFSAKTEIAVRIVNLLK